ncbi:MAG TPA: hypothetical protein PL157_08325, partial [Acidobacteriota bacterium]|nr:hypothetical protein [Acidobacteriota bacterium]
GMFVLLIPMLLGQFGSSAHTGLTQTPKEVELPQNYQFTHSLAQPQLVNMAQLRAGAAAKKVTAGPKAIQAGTALSKVTFYGNGATTVLAAADTNDDKVPDGSARETFTAGDPNTEDFAAVAASAKTQKVYAGSFAFDGPTITEGTLTVLDNPNGDFKGNVIREFSIGKGMPAAIAVKDSPAGDIVIVMSVYFQAASPFDFTDGDFLSITAYLPGADGTPDGSQKVDVLPARALSLGGDPVVFSFGGMALSQNGNLIANLVAKNDADGFAGGATFVFVDNDGDGIPDNQNPPTAFAQFNDANAANLITAASVVPLEGGKIGVLSADVFSDVEMEIFVYNDANGDGKADDVGTKIFNESRTLPGILLIYGEGTSGYLVNRMAGSGDKLIFSFIDFQNGPRGSGLASVPVAGGNATKAFDVNNVQSEIIACVATASGVSSDSVPPTVQVISPNGGETVQSGTELSISWTSSDDKGVTSQDISLSNDSGGAFPFVVATGLAGTAQSFSFPIPGALETPNARIQVTVRDGGGNVGIDASDSDFVIQVGAGTDSQPPAVTVTSPTAGSTLNGGTSSTVNFSSTDNVGVISHSIAFAADGATFSTTLATGLPGSATSFNFTVPNQATTTGVIRVRAFDGAGNSGDGLSGAFTVSSDTVKPTVTVTSPSASTKKVKRGDPINVAWTSTDNGTIAKHDVLLSTDDGATFGTSLATGLAGTAQSFTATAPSSKVKKAIIKVIATDAAGNAGEGLSTKFKVK